MGWGVYYTLVGRLNDAVRNARGKFEESKKTKDTFYIERLYEKTLGEARNEAYEGSFEVDSLVLKLQEYKDLNHSWSDGKTGLGLDIRGKDKEEDFWRTFAKYAVPLEKAKRLGEEYSFIKRDKDEEGKINNVGKINIYVKVQQIIPGLESKGLYKELCVIREAIALVESGRV